MKRRFNEWMSRYGWRDADRDGSPGTGGGLADVEAYPSLTSNISLLGAYQKDRHSAARGRPLVEQRGKLTPWWSAPLAVDRMSELV